MSEVEGVPQQLFDEAAQWNAHIYGNWAAWEEVIHWADAWIAHLESWPDEITEISLNGRHKDSGARAALAELARKGHFDAVILAQQALKDLERGTNPFEIVARLYPLTYDHYFGGGLEFSLETPKPLRDAIYRLDYTTEEIEPQSGWNRMEPEEGAKYLAECIRTELTEAMAEISGGNSEK